MNSPFLERILLKFPGQDDPFPDLLSEWLQVLGTWQGSRLEINSSGEDFYPKIQLDFAAKDQSGVRVDFVLSNGTAHSIGIENTSGVNKQSPHAYSHLPIEPVLLRLAEHGITPAGMDHAGCNLPWFAEGIHPRIQTLREILCRACLYHRFPTGEAWDFILPGRVEEIDGSEPVDYSRTRHPKFEIVSFEKTSIPLVQFDLQLKTSYETLRELFPEGLNDPDLRNLWIYLVNPFGIDVCFVANEVSKGDWSEFFKGCRIS
jgi:hypothetical protein